MSSLFILAVKLEQSQTKCQIAHLSFVNQNIVFQPKYWYVSAPDLKTRGVKMIICKRLGFALLLLHV